MKAIGKIKNIIIVTVIAAALALPIIFMTACGSEVSTNGKFGSLNTTESIYGFSAASAGILISASHGGEAATLAQQKGIAVKTSAAVTEGEVADPAADPVLSEIDGYMALVDGLLSDGGFKTTVSESDREGYTEKTTVTYTDISGNSLQYVMYYNEILLPGDDDNDPGETEEEYAIEGVMVVDGTDYAIRGERSIENEADESESETEFRVTLGENKYLYVEQGYETETEHGVSEYEQEYSYSLVENDRTTERSTFSYEVENDETELKMVTTAGGVTNTFYFEREHRKDGEYISLRVGSGKEVKNYLIRVVENADGSVDYEYIA